MIDFGRPQVCITPLRTVAHCYAGPHARSLVRGETVNGADGLLYLETNTDKGRLYIPFKTPDGVECLEPADQDSEEAQSSQAAVSDGASKAEAVPTADTISEESIDAAAAVGDKSAGDAPAGGHTAVKIAQKEAAKLTQL